MSKFSSYSRPATGLTGKPAVKQEVMTWRPPGMDPPYNERLARERAKQTKQNEKDVAPNA